MTTNTEGAKAIGFDVTTNCALCGQQLALAYEGKALWDQDPPLGQYASDRLEMLCDCGEERARS